MIKNWLVNNWIWLVWLVSIAYCIYRLSKRYKKSSLDGITGYQPGLDMLAVLVMAPVLMIVDMIVNLYRHFRDEKKENSSI